MDFVQDAGEGDGFVEVAGDFFFDGLEGGAVAENHAGEEEDGDVGTELLEFVNQNKTVAFIELDVEDDQVGAVGPGDLAGFGKCGGGGDAVAGQGEAFLEEVANGLFIINGKNVLFHGFDAG